MNPIVEYLIYVLMGLIFLFILHSSLKKEPIPFLTTQHLWVVIKISEPEGFEGDKIFRSEKDANTYRMYFASKDYQVTTVEKAMELIMEGCFD